MSAHEEIGNLMNAYCYAIDSGDFLTFAQLFANAEWIAEGQKPSKESADNLIIYDDGTPKTKHVISNIRIDIDENETSARRIPMLPFGRRRRISRYRQFSLAIISTVLRRSMGAGALPAAKSAIHWSAI